MQKALLLIWHGSKQASAVSEFFGLVTLFRNSMPDYLVEGACMEISAPLIPEVIGKLASQGVTEILAMPCFFFQGNHVNHTIPEILNKVKAHYPGITLKMASPVGAEPLMAQLLAEKVNQFNF